MRVSSDYYAVLGISSDASDSEIKGAYRRLARQYHPDVNPGGQEGFLAINEAYRILIDPQARARFDQGEDPGTEEGITISEEDLDAYFLTVASFIGPDLLDVGPATVTVTRPEVEFSRAGLLFVGPAGAMFINEGARADAMRGQLLPIDYIEIGGTPRSRINGDDSHVVVYVEGRQGHAEFWVRYRGDASLITSLVDAAKNASRDRRSTHAPERSTASPVASETSRRGTAREASSGWSVGGVVKKVLLGLFALSVLAKLLTAMGMTDTSDTGTGSAAPQPPAATQAAAPTPSDSNTSGPEPSLTASEDDLDAEVPTGSWDSAKASFAEYDVTLPGQTSAPIVGAGDVDAVAVEWDGTDLTVHAYTSGSWGEWSSGAVEWAEADSFEWEVVDTSGQGGADLVITLIDSAEDVAYGAVFFNNGNVATFADEEGEGVWIRGLEYSGGELVVPGYSSIEYIPGKSRFEMTSA